MMISPSDKPLSAGHYAFERYISQRRWNSYWNQLSEIVSIQPSSALEIGIGSGIVSTLLSQMGISIRTVDIEPDLSPDCVASVLNLPFADAAHDLVVCFEVLEHLPYEHFLPACRELRRVCCRHVLLSLPDASPNVQFMTRLPKIGVRRIALTLPHPIPRLHTFDGEHYWEIGKRGYGLKRISADLEKAGLTITRTYRDWSFPYHRFFVLQRAP